jgi:tetratricopeptide (TPR) repeat protein
MLRELNEFAVISLEEKLKGLQANLPIADWYEDERITNAMLNLVHHLFWLEEERGWAYAVPRFVEAWQYDYRWGEGLLEVIDSFKENLCPLGRKRLKIFQQGFNWIDQDTQAILDELKKIARQKNWLQGEGQEEREAILSLKQGQIYQEQKKYTEALQVYLAVKEQLTQPLDSLKNSLSKALESLGHRLGWQEKPDYQTAVIAYQHSSELDPQNDGTWFRLGFALVELGRYEEAINRYDKALEIKPDYHEAWYNRGVVLGNLGKYEEAIASYDKALKIKPNQHKAYYNKACCYALQNQIDLALEFLPKAIELDAKLLEMAKTDNDFDSIRDDPRFQTLIFLE